jgi:hypothetical protein
MKNGTRRFNRRLFLKGGLAAGAAAAAPLPRLLWADELARDYALAPIPLQDVEVTDAFWSPRIEKARRVSLPILLGLQEGLTEHIDSRVIEASAYFLAKTPDHTLQTMAKSLFAPLSTAMRAQMGVWSNVGDGPFLETGHFFEAAIAYRQATGDTQLLNVAIEVADDLDRQYGPGRRTDISNHEGIELALVKLYRATGDYKYVRLARFIFDQRGTTNGGRRMTGLYAQDNEPVVAQQRAIGHCVRATYLYCGLTDLAALTLETAYRDAALRIWDDAVAKRTYITGGIGSYRRMENYGDDYDLPNASCWNEICAACGNALWNRRMLQLTGESRYADTMEQILYNGLLAGVSQQGDRFLYQTPLKTFAGFARQASFGPNCCPPNITRVLAQLGTLVYARDARNVYVDLFIGSNARFSVDGKPIKLRQETIYPWEGLTQITVEAASPARFALHVRIPGWTQNEPMPGGPYHYDGAARGSISLLVNGKSIPVQLSHGYAMIEREWSGKDVVELALPMEVRRVKADERVRDNRGMVALQRGPVVFCAEAVDNAGGVFNLVVPEDAKLEFSREPGLRDGVGTLRGTVQRLSRGEGNHPVTVSPADLVAIPYYAFANRASTEMAVWLAGDSRRAVMAPLPTIASTSVASSSCGEGAVADNYPGHRPPTPAQRMYPTSQDGSGHIAAICDQLMPVNSEDGSAPFLRLRPQAGSAAWVQYDFAKPAEVSSVSVYWKDDEQFCVAPEKWNLLYRDGAEWRPVQSASGFGVERDTFNRTLFAPVRTDGLRLEIALAGKVYKTGELGPPDANYLTEDTTWYEGGIIEWVVNDQPQAPGVFISSQANHDHALDADPDSNFWKPARSIVLDRSILGDPDPGVRSEARSRWTKDNLYFLFWGPYETLHLKPDPDTQHETYKLWFYDDYELYLGANFENINLYGEFQISPQSEFLDMAIDATREKPGWGDEHLWDSGMTVTSRIDAARKVWYGEMCIPIAAIDKRPAAIGNEFRVNVYRLQSAGEGKRIHFLAWQPTWEWNPHRPMTFGRLRLAGAPKDAALA